MGYLNFVEQRKLSSIMNEISCKCKCGHTVHIPPKLDHILCSWCGKYIFRTPLDEFKYRFKERNINLANK